MTIQELYELIDEKCHESFDALGGELDECKIKKVEGYTEALQWVLDLIEESTEEEEL